MPTSGSIATLAAPASLETMIKRSRFVAHANRVDSLADTLKFFESVANRAATHNCWAWRIGHDYRFNDDGEPSGTAGRPILTAIEGKGLDHVMVVVTRHFGGIKLGAGGLVRAYSGSTARCLDQARIAELRPTVVCELESSFEWTGQVHGALDAVGARKLAEEFTARGARIRVEVAQDEFARLRAMLRDGTRGAVEVVRR